MTSNEIWAAAQADKRRIPGSEHTNQVSNKLRVSNLFTQHGTVRQRSARSAVGVNVAGSNTRAQTQFYSDTLITEEAAVQPMTSVKRDADFHESPLWDIVDLDEVARSYFEKTHPFKIQRLPAILRIRIMEMRE